MISSGLTVTPRHDRTQHWTQSQEYIPKSQERETIILSMRVNLELWALCPPGRRLVSVERMLDSVLDGRILELLASIGGSGGRRIGGSARASTGGSCRRTAPAAFLQFLYSRWRKPQYIVPCTSAPQRDRTTANSRGRLVGFRKLTGGTMQTGLLVPT